MQYARVILMVTEARSYLPEKIHVRFPKPARLTTQLPSPGQVEDEPVPGRPADPAHLLPRLLPGGWTVVTAAWGMDSGDCCLRDGQW